MAVKIRLRRMGKQKAPFYRVSSCRFPFSQRDGKTHRGDRYLTIRNL